MKKTILAAALLCAASPALADAGWSHSYTPGVGGQYEGIYRVDGDRYGVDYACSLSNSIYVYAKGVQNVPGKVSLLVDGTLMFMDTAVYDGDTASMEWRVDPFNGGYASLVAFNELINGFAKGSQATIVTPDGTQFPVSLKGSNDISACLIR